MLTRILFVFIVLGLTTNGLTQVITTLAGNGTWGYSGNGGPATSAQLADVVGVAADKQGNIYIADFYNNVIRKVNTAGIISNYAGTGVLGYSGDGGPATSAKLYHPATLAIDNVANLYFTDQNADVIRKIGPAGIITSITGHLPIGYSGDGGPVHLAQFRSITGITPDNSGNIYITDGSNHVIRKVNSSGIINTIAGNGTRGFSGDGGPATSAQLNSPYNVVLDKVGNIYIPDLVNNRIRRVNTAGIISTFAGNGTKGYSGDGGTAADASFNLPSYLATDSEGNIYVADYINLVVRKISTTGIITTFAGSGKFGQTGDGGPAVSATMSDIRQIATDNLDNLYIVNRSPFHVVRKVTNCVLPTITNHPANASLCNTGDAVFSISADNATAYKWQMNMGSIWTDLVDNALYSGTASSSLKITGATTSLHSNQYRCLAINSCGNASSIAASLSVTPPLDPVVNIQTANTTICKGKDAVFTAVPLRGGSQPLFTWFKNGIVTGTNSPTYTDNNLVTGDVITCRLTTNTNCVTKNTAESNAITMVVNPASYCTGPTNATCSDSLFIKTFLHKDTSLITFDLIATDNSDVMGCGSVRNSTHLSDDAFIVRWDKNGNIVWQRTLSADGAQTILKLIRLRDGNYMAIGFDMRAGQKSYFIFKFDGAGGVIFRKELLLPWSYGSGVTGLHETENKEIVITGSFAENNSSFWDRMFFIKLHEYGTTLLSKQITPPGPINVFSPRSSVSFDGFTYICGMHFAPDAKGLMIKVNNANGNIVWSKVYDFNNKEAVFNQIFKYPGNKLCIIGRNSFGESESNLIMIIDTTGVVEVSKTIQYSSSRTYERSTLDKGGNIILASYYQKPGSNDFTLLSVNPYSGVNWSKNYQQLSSNPLPNGITFSADSSLFVAGVKDLGRRVHTFLGRFSKDGNVGCAPIPLATTMRTGYSNSTNISLTSTDNNLTYPGHSVDILSDVIKSGEDICKYQILCNTLKLSAPDTLCGTIDTLKVRITKNAECFLTPDLFYDASKMTLQSVTDSSAIFTISTAGIMKIKVQLANRCDMLADSIEVRIFANPGGINLGFDTVICSGKSLLLKAGSNFKSYSWQDGSTDSTFEVTKPGLYYVSATDSCNNIHSDSIDLFIDSPVSFDLGPDKSKCNDDSITMTAPPGFNSYSWTPVYNISSTRGQAVTVFPAVSTKYYVEANKPNGCSISDSIMVTVNRSLAIGLPNDTSICSKDSIILNAGNTFANYSWSTGDNTASIVVKNAGAYVASFTDINKCISKDTFNLKNVYALPAFTLGNDTAICRNTQLVLQPGNFASYRWHDSSIGNSFPASNTGTYWVEVTDNNSCKNTDTVRILGLKGMPMNFLPDTLSMCQGDEITLKSFSAFSKYLWSTGSGQPSVTIYVNGTYWLRVTNEEGCANTDTTLVSYKSCSNVVYFPSAFTPNGDFKNDVYKAKTFGSIKEFQLVILNRLGQKVFETTDVNSGWDGTLYGTPLSTGSFVWYSVYRFSGATETLQSQKGTLVLIR